MASGNSAEVLQKFRGDIYFVKNLVASHVGRPSLSATNGISGTCQLNIPRSFVKAHADKFQKSVVLHSGNKTWMVRVSVCPSRSPPEVVFCDGWRRFVGDNGLAKGDKLIFYWIAMSNFEVYMFSSRGESKGPQILRMQPFTTTDVSQQKVNKLPLGEIKHEEQCTTTDMSQQKVSKMPLGGIKREEQSTTTDVSQQKVSKLPLGGIKREEQSTTTDVSQQKVNKLPLGEIKCEEQSTTTDVSQQKVNKLPLGEIKCEEQSTTTDVSQQKVSKLPLGGIKREELTDEEFENLLYESDHGRSSRRPDASEEQFASLPAAFRKRLRLRARDRTLGGTMQIFHWFANERNLHYYQQEIPVHFARKYGNWLKHRLHFQGIHEDSPVRTVGFTYYMDRGRFRFYLTEGWNAFWKENRLREGQELVFTLVSDSFLKVRDPGSD